MLGDPITDLTIVPESRNSQAAGRPDWPCSILVTAGLGGVIFAMIESSKRSWSDPILIVAALTGVFALIAFAVLENRTKAPLLSITLFRSRNFAGANLLTLFLYSALSSMFFFLPLNLIQVQHYTATAADAASSTAC